MERDKDSGLEGVAYRESSLRMIYIERIKGSGLEGVVLRKLLEIYGEGQREWVRRGRIEKIV